MAAKHSDEQHPFVPGYIESPPDERDYPVDALYDALGIAKPELDALATSYMVPSPPPVLNQGVSPRCVAFSLSAVKSWQDYDDRDPHRWYPFDEVKFFTQIGGTSQGAIIRNGLDRLVHYGYPVVGSSTASAHRIAAYYAVPKTKYDIMAAVSSLGVLECGSTWYNSWCRYGFNVFPAADYSVGGHAYAIIGYNTTGVVVQNSWGTQWGAGDGRATMPWSTAVGRIREIWKTRDA